MRSPSAASARRRTARLDAIIAVAVLVFSLSASGAAIAAEGAPQSVDFEFPPHGKIRWQRGQTPVLLVYPQRGDGWINLAQRYTGGSGGVAALRSANPKLGTPLRDRPVRVPMELLGADLRLEAVRRVFPVDERVDAGWRHLVLDPFHGGEESWKWLAALFAGAAERATELKRANPQLAAQGLERGRWVLVPESGLLPVFKRLTPVPTPTPVVLPTVVARPSAAIAATTGPLQYGADELGEYAVYRLRQGEALYSAVVVRFTGQLLAVQVNETAMEIAARSGIDDVTDIPVGYPIKIPLDLLLPDYLPPDDPRRVVWDEERRDLGRFLEVVQATDLAGVQVILDAGHGGKDSGAVVDGWWEATYAYDIMCRIKVNLERHTRAKVWTTIEQTVPGYVVPAVDRLDQRRDARLLTRPPYPLVDSVLGVHLRWYLTNDIILNRLGAGFPRSKTVFLSVHADSLHPSVRGAMVYVPSRYLRPTEPYTVKHREINRFAEYRNHPTVRFGTDFKARAEASSRHLANSIIASLEDNQIGVHPYEPVRDRVLRGRRSWVPAVLRYTAAQNAVLVEACNMSNPQDRALLLQAQWREEFARAVVEGMASAFAK